MMKYLVNRKELNGLITAAKRVNEIATIVATDVKPKTPPQNPYKSQPIYSIEYQCEISSPYSSDCYLNFQITIVYYMMQ